MAKPVIIGDCTLYLGDCLDILPTLGKVDAVVTDPPYGTGGWRRDKTGQGSNPRASLVKEEWDDGSTAWLAAVSPAPVFSFVPPSPEWLGGFQRAGYKKFRWLYMKKLDPKPQVSGRIMWSVEPICVASHDGFQLYGGTDWIEASTPRAGRDADGTGHPYQKPAEVLHWLLRKTLASTILDPFMGSGTTGVACVKLNRKFIGIEIEPKYFDIACKRIEDTYQRGLFFEDKKKLKFKPL